MIAVLKFLLLEHLSFLFPPEKSSRARTTCAIQYTMNFGTLELKLIKLVYEFIQSNTNYYIYYARNVGNITKPQLCLDKERQQTRNQPGVQV